MVAYQAERAALREYGRLLINRAIRKSKPHTVGNAVTLCRLCRLAIGKGLAV
jgi:hypothetical protein